MTNKRTNPEFLNGVPELLVLRLLAQRPMYGYQLVQAIKDASRSRFEFGEGCIYPILHRLQGQKDLLSKRESVDNRTRVVYHLTPQGKNRLQSSVDHWQEVVATVQAILQGGLPHASIDLA
jgi:PadR family transcriptional regulator, regulatory protein PadR